MEKDKDQFSVLRSLDKEQNISQRKLASDLGFSLGKLNYLMNALKTRGLIKIKRFKRNKKKIGYLYVLTPAGISKRYNIATKFLSQKLSEYEELKKEISKFEKEK